LQDHSEAFIDRPLQARRQRTSVLRQEIAIEGQEL
jgi:hypothetical protein